MTGGALTGVTVTGSMAGTIVAQGAGTITGMSIGSLSGTMKAVEDSNPSSGTISGGTVTASHGGTISAGNAQGGGARFHFRLPITERLPQ